MTALMEEKIEFIDTTEVHWSTGTILAIFFAASLVSAVFFGLGYTLGRGTPTLAVSAGAASSIDSAQSAPVERPVQNIAGSSTRARAVAVTSKRTSNEPAIPAHASTVAAKIAKPVPVEIHQKAMASTGDARFMVQIGAIGDRKDARTLVSKLRKKGFRAGIYPARHDKFLHVQLGPFATEDQADAVRHRVIASGYHAILKHAS